MMRSKRAQWILSILMIGFGMMLIYGALFISLRGYDYPFLVGLGFFVGLSGGLFFSFLFYDFLQNRLGLKGRWRSKRRE